MRPLALALVLVAACKEEEPPPPPEETDVGTREITLRFRGVVGGDEHFDCRRRYESVGASFSEPRVTDLRFYLHAIRLTAEDGTEHPVALLDDRTWQDGTVALVDLEDGVETCEGGTPETRAYVVGTAPDLPYTQLTFALGVPGALNHPTVLERAPLDVPSMFRNTTDGFWFFRTGFSTAAEPSWPVAIGSVGCTGDGTTGISCQAENVVEFTFVDFDPDVSTIVVDLAELARGVDLESNGSSPTTESPPGCTSVPGDPDCQAVYRNYGLSAVAPTFLRVAQDVPTAP